MSKNRNRAKLSKATNNHEYNIIQLKILYPPYYEDGINYYPRYRKGYKNPTKQIYSYQVRMYRSWKYNRKTKWK